ncbi:MAG: hypothetical protein WCD18_15350 [Thermosynechococcaceae cyanobacterium]
MNHGELTLISFNSSGVLGLASEKNLSPEQRRRITATAAALDLIAIAVAVQGSQHKLSDEISRLSEYTDAIEASLQRKKP